MSSKSTGSRFIILNFTLMKGLGFYVRQGANLIIFMGQEWKLKAI